MRWQSRLATVVCGLLHHSLVTELSTKPEVLVRSRLLLETARHNSTIIGYVICLTSYLLDYFFVQCARSIFAIVLLRSVTSYNNNNNDNL